MKIGVRHECTAAPKVNEHHDRFENRPIVDVSHVMTTSAAYYSRTPWPIHGIIVYRNQSPFGVIEDCVRDKSVGRSAIIVQ
jgi:hypothetical protein